MMTNNLENLDENNPPKYWTANEVHLEKEAMKIVQQNIKRTGSNIINIATPSMAIIC